MNDTREKIEYVRLADMTPYERNPRINDAAVPLLVESIKRYGFTNPIVLNGRNVIINGHTRWKAAQEAGLVEAPCIIRRDLTEEQEREFRLADNRVAEYSRWDAELLRFETDELARLGIDLSAVGLSALDINQICGALTPSEVAVKTDDELDDAPPVDKSAPPKSRRGEVYRIGRHRLMCGDATSAKDVAALCGGRQMDLWLTDPPYNVDYGARGEQYKARAKQGKGDYQCGKSDRKIMNDSMDDASFSLFLRAAFAPAAEAMRPGAPFYVWHASRTQATFEASLNACGLEVREQLVWRKSAITLGRQDYQWKHEPCFYGWKEGAARTWNADRKQTTVLELSPPGLEFDSDGNALLEVNGVIYRIKADALLEEMPTTVMSFPKPMASRLHPTMKPVALFKYLMGNSSATGAAVLDSFGGSGTTIIAAEATGRTAYCMELDPAYADVIRKRFNKLAGGRDEDWEINTPITTGTIR